MGRRKKTAFDRATRQDDYVNELTGIGDYTRDRMYGGRQYGALDFFVREFTQEDLEARWRGSDLGCRLIEAIPDEMTREGWELSVQPSEDEEAAPEDGEKPKPGEKPLAEGKRPTKEDAFGGPPDPMAALMGEGPKNPKPIEPADDEPQQIREDVEAKMEELCAMEAITRALQYERAYGGAVILLGADDGTKDLTKPLNEENIKAINWLNVFGGGRDGEVIAYSYYNDPKSEKFGQPEVYEIRNLIPISQPPIAGRSPRVQTLKETQFQVHESRLLIFPGTAVSARQRVKAFGWGDSIFTRVDEVLSQYSQTWGGVANLMSQLHIDVLKMSGFSIGMAGGNKTANGSPLANRAHQINTTKSIARMLVIDGEEEFERATASLAGVHETLQEFAVRLAAAADMPVTLLMGTSPGGLNATGESDIRFFYDRIGARQKRHLLPILRRLYKLVMLSKEGPTGGVEPEKWNLKFNPLRQLSELEQAELRKTVADMDKVYIDAAVISPEEVAASRFGGSEWSMETTIDFEGRQKMAEEDAAQMEEKKAKAEEMAGQQMEMANKELDIKAKAATKKPPAKK